MRLAAHLVALSMSVAAVAMSAQQPVRDAPLTPTTGTASISGMVVNDDETPQPVRRAIVTLAGPELKPSRGAITDDDGRFTIANLPAGRFTLTVARAAFVTSVYGAKRPGRPGTPIVVADGGRVANLVVRLWRGAAIAGVIRDDAGAPVPNLAVTAIPARENNEGAILTLTNNGTTTNELGEYRIFGLEPGTYVVSTRPSSSGGGPMTALSEGQVDAALAALQRRGQTPAAQSTAAPSAAAPPRPFAWAPVFFPGTTLLDQAAPITLKAGDERLGVDIALQRVSTATVEGTIARPDGSPAGGATLQLTRVIRPGPFTAGQPARLNATAGADGRFRIAQVLPGDYRLVARVPASPPPPPTPGLVRPPTGDGSFWATADLSVTGSDITGLALSAEDGLTISGRIVFTSSQTPPTPAPDMRGLRVTLLAPWILNLKPGTPIDSIGFSAGAIVQPDGTFRMSGLLRDTYVLRLQGGTIGAPWSLRSATIGDRDLLDTPMDFANLPAGGSLVITYSDRRSELSGMLQTPSGTAYSDVFILAYSTDRRFWVQRSRRVQAVRPGVDGRFVFGDLPPGEYFLGAVTDVDTDEWLDAGFLDGVVPASTKVTIGEGEKRVQDLRIGG
jgi:hypothetical protein